MLAYQIPDSSYRRIIKNDTSGQFKLIININQIENHDDSIAIEKHNQIVITTTINKARIISKTIDEMVTLDATLDHFEFEFNNKNKIKIDEIVEIFKLIIGSIDNEVIITEDQKDIFSSILNLLGEDNNKININTNQNVSIQQQTHDIFNCDFEGNELSGIISCIKQMTGSDFDENIIKLSCGGTVDQNYPLTNIIKYEQGHVNDYFYNFLMPPQKDDGWIEFDFKNKRINVASYTIRTNGNREYLYHPKSWKIIGSNDQINWDLIDLQNESFVLNGANKQHRFICQNSNKYYQYIRYVEINTFPNNYYNNYICLSCVEFFGSISS